MNHPIFNFPPTAGISKLRPSEIIVDLFAGGGGASEALRQALGRDPDIAINHDADAIGMHAANHPFTVHYREDVWQADPVREVAVRPVGWFHASPDCTHFSQAKGGQPRDRAVRSLAWVIPKWCGKLKRQGCAPRIGSMENVWQMLKWGPLVAKRCKATGRVVKLDGSVAAKGERVPLQQQFLIPDKRREGRSWRKFVGIMQALGYAFEWRRLNACDYGAGTSRERLFALFRCDGQTIQWPPPTHGNTPGLHPFVTAADCIDWSIPCPSIFERARPLADATCRRIAKGIHKFILDAAEPFIVPATHHGERRAHPMDEPLPTVTAAHRGELMLVSPRMAPFLTEHANGSSQRVFAADEPLRTQVSGIKGGHFSAVAASLVQMGYGERIGQSPRTLNISAPLGTVVGGGRKHAVVSAFLEQANGGFYTGAGNDLRQPAPTIVGSGSQQRLVTASLIRQFGHSSASDVGSPVGTITAGGSGKTLLMTADLASSQQQTDAALRVAAFLIKYYGTAHGEDLRDPLDTVTTRDRLALVTVTIKGMPYVIVDIGLRMLKPAELYRAQGFPADYIIDRTADGRRLSISASTRMCGNSVSPPPLAAIARSNLDPAQNMEAQAA